MRAVPVPVRAAVLFCFLPLLFLLLLRPYRASRIFSSRSWVVRASTFGELVPEYGENEVLPKAVRDTLAQPDDPFAAREIQRVLPDRPADARVKEQIVCRGQEARGWVYVRPEGPERLDRAKGRNFLDTLFVIGDSRPRTSLLAEPEDPNTYVGGGARQGSRYGWYSKKPCP